MSEFVGYNPNQVKSLRDSVNNTTPQVATSIINNLRNGIVTPMSNAWYTPEGKEFFESFSESVKSTGPVIEQIFNSFIKGLQEAANNWAQNVKGESISLSNVESCNMILDVSAIKDKNGNGDLGIDQAGATSVANSVDGIRETIDSELSSMSTRLSAEAAFMGKGQADAITACFSLVSQEVAKIFKFLNEDSNGQSLKTAINKAVEKYGDVGTSTASYFNAG